MRPSAYLVLLASFLMLLVSSAALAAPSSSVMGYWKTPVGSVIRIEPCGGNVCLTVVKLSSSAPETTDQKNPNASLRHRPLCGLAIGTGFHKDDPSHLTGGQLYDPKSGHTYRGTIAADGDALHLRGYIGISLFGRSETWHRVAAVVACK